MTRLPALWQRNVIGAIVVAAALGILVAIDLGPQWATYRGTVIAEHVVPVGQSGTADGRTWKVESIRHLNRSPLNFGPPLPAGTVLIVVTLDRSGPLPDDLCVGVITDGAQRWTDEGIGGFHPIPADGVTSMCNKAGQLQYAFLLPNDVVPTAMDVTADGRIMVRMLL